MNSNYRKVYAYTGIEVSEKGGVRRAYENKSSILGIPTYHNLSFKTDENGNKVVCTKDYGKLRVDKLVCQAFWGNPKGNQTFVIHKDKDKAHCWKNNLRWASTYEYGEFYKNDPIVNTPDGFRMIDDQVYVSKDGEIKIDGKMITLIDYLYDPDLDQHRAIDLSFNPNGTTNRFRERVDVTVAKAFLPTPVQLSNPVLLHKDGDYMNCKLENLEWVDGNSQSYIAYQQQRQIAIDARNNQLIQEFNGH